MYLRSIAIDVAHVDHCNADVHFGRSVVIEESTQTTENIIGYVVLAIVVGLVLVGFAGVYLVRSCCAYVRETRQNWKRRRARRRIASSSSSIAPNEKAQILTTTALRSDHSEKTAEAAPSPPTNKIISHPPPYNNIGSNLEGVDHYGSDDNGDYHNNTGTVVRSPSPVHVNFFNHPGRNLFLQIHHGDRIEESTPSTSIRPHGIPLTTLPEDVSCTESKTGQLQIRDNSAPAIIFSRQDLENSFRFALRDHTT